MSVGLDRMISGLSFQHLRTYVGMNSTTRPQMNMPPHPSHQTFRASPASYECVYASNNCPRLPPLMLRHLSSIIMSHARQRTAHCPFKLGPYNINMLLHQSSVGFSKRDIIKPEQTLIHFCNFTHQPSLHRLFQMPDVFLACGFKTSQICWK